MDWGRYIKRTAVRRVVWIVVGLIVYATLSAFGVARAQSADDKGQAYAKCQARAAIPHGAPYNAGNQCVDRPSQSSDAEGYWQCLRFNAEGQSLSCTGTNQFPYSGNCEARGRYERNTNTSLMGPPASYECNAGCEFVKTIDAAGLYCALVEEGPRAGYWCNSEYTPTGAMCTGGGDGRGPGDGADPTPQDPDAPPKACGTGEVRLPDGRCSPRGNCPLGQHEVNGECHPTGSCPTGTVKAPDGSCAAESCPVNFVRGPDGTCKIDENNDGEPDEDEPGDGGDGDTKSGNKFSGGDSCSVPPACSGDPVMCGQARIQWRIDCNTRTASGAVGGDHCDSFNMPICVGEHCDPVENKQMILQWRAMCALESLVNQEGGDGERGGDDDFDAYGAGEGDAMAMGDGGLGGPEGIFDDTCDGEDCPSGSLDRSGYGYSSSCPPPPQFNFGGRSFVIDTGPMCDWLQLGSYFVLLLAGLASARIINGGT